MAIILSNKMDFNFCAYMDGFPNPLTYNTHVHTNTGLLAHTYVYTLPYLPVIHYHTILWLHHNIASPHRHLPLQKKLNARPAQCQLVGGAMYAQCKISQQRCTYLQVSWQAIYHIARKFGEFGESSLICQTKTIQISTYNYNLLAESIHSSNFFLPNAQKK